MNLKIHGKMVLDIISIIAHNPRENRLIRMIKNHQPLKGELVGRLSRDKWQTKWIQESPYHQETFKVRRFNHQLTYGIKQNIAKVNHQPSTQSINGGHRKRPRINPKILIWFSSDSWVTFILPTCILAPYFDPLSLICTIFPLESERRV